MILRQPRTAPTESLKLHPRFNLVPDMRDGEWSDFYADIAFKGITTPLEVLGDGTILDGRHRFKAAQELGMATVPVVDVPLMGDDPETYMLKAAVLRRHLTDDQRAMMAARWIQEHKIQGQRTSAGRTAEVVGTHPTRTEALDLFSVSRHRVSEATKVLRADNELADQVQSGDKPLTESKRQIKEREREVRREENRERISTATAPVTGAFSTIVVDPPWDWGDEGDVDQLGRARPDYATLSIDEIEKLPVGSYADEDCHLYLWITNRSLPKGFRLLDAWGFRYVTCLTWTKPSIGMGNYFRGSTEHILFGIKGSQALMRRDVGTWFAAPRGPKHSSKPNEFYDLIESCSPGPYLDLFGRQQRQGWIVWGADA